MKEGDVVLVPLPQADGRIKSRPAIVLRTMPPFADLLVCGISTQLHQEVAGFDDLLDPSHVDYPRQRHQGGLADPSGLPGGFARHWFSRGDRQRFGGAPPSPG